MSEHIKIDKSKIVKVGMTYEKGNGEVLLFVQGGMPAGCMALFITEEYWVNEVKDRVYA